MEATIIAAYLRLYHCTGISHQQFSRLLKQAGNITVILDQNDEWLQSLGMDPGQISMLRRSQGSASMESKIEEDLRWQQSRGNAIVGYESPDYPPLLRTTDFPPPLLYAIGDSSVLSTVALGIVGSRKASEYGGRNAYWIAHELSHAGLLICSGMARGIDTQAHKGALAASGATVAVLGTGIDICHPLANQKLAEQIAVKGALISDFPLGSPPRANNFPRRNRIISGMSLGTLVVEATAHSGSLITARLALEENREVFAFPGSISSQLSRGCHRLIKEGAKLVEEPADILEELGMKSRGAARLESTANSTQKNCGAEAPSLNEHEANIMRLIGGNNCLMQTLLDSSGYSLQQLNALLLHLEMLGLVRAEGGRFSCTDPAL